MASDREPSSETLRGVYYYYRRVALQALRHTGDWVLHYAALEVLLPFVSTLFIGLTLGWPQTTRDWLIVLSPFIAVGLTVVMVLGAYLVLTPYRIDRSAIEFLKKWDKRNVEAISSTPFVYLNMDGAFLIVPRLHLINPDHEKDIDLDIDVEVRTRLDDVPKRLPLDAEPPDGLLEAMHPYQRGGKFLTDPIRLPRRGREYGFVSVFLPDFMFSPRLTPQVIEDFESIKFSISDAVIHTIMFPDVDIWPSVWELLDTIQETSVPLPPDTFGAPQ